MKYNIEKGKIGKKETTLQSSFFWKEKTQSVVVE